MLNALAGPARNIKSVAGKERKTMYTDPGILSMIIAAVVGGIVAVPAYLVLFRNKIRSWFDGRKRKKHNRIQKR